MLERASGQFIIDGQVEDILGGISGAARIARISQTCRFTGELEGESLAEFTAVLPREGDGSFHGFQRVSGTLGEREGTFVLSVSGEIHKGQPRGAWSIVPKSGSGDFVHIRGGGEFSLPDGKPGKYRLEFDLRKPRASKAAAAIAPLQKPAAESIDLDEAIETPVIEPSVPVEEKPVRKPRFRKAEPSAEAVSATPAKRSRSRKAEHVSAEPVPETPAKRARSRKVEPVSAEPVAVVEPVVKRGRSRAAESRPAETPPIEVTPAPSARTRAKKTAVAAAEPAAPEPKRSRTRKADPVTPVETVADAGPKPKRTRSRKPEPEAPAPVGAKSTAKPKRSRKPVADSAATEPAAAAEPVRETASPKPARRKKAAPARPVILPVVEKPAPRKRRSKAA